MSQYLVYRVNISHNEQRVVRLGQCNMEAAGQVGNVRDTKIKSCRLSGYIICTLTDCNNTGGNANMSM